jgi:hypothetical protein
MGTQKRFSDGMEWLSARERPREDMSTIPFIGQVSGETPALRSNPHPETRRRDLGPQKYGHATTAFKSADVNRYGNFTGHFTQNGNFTDFETSHGDIHIPSTSPDLGSMPTADAVLFLKYEYLGSRAPTPPQRYFPG